MNDLLATPDFSATAAVWAEVSPALGYGTARQTLHLVRARLSDAHQRVVVLAIGQGGAPDLILKHSLSGQERQHFDKGVAAHRRAAQAFDTAPRMHVPDLLYVVPERQFLVMEAAEGKTAFDLIADDETTRAEVLWACGAWMRHWHDGTYDRDNPINPNVVQKSLRGLRDRVATGKRQVARPRAFLACAALVDEMAEAARGHVTKLASTHGDLNLRNFIIGPEGTTVIDFGANHTVPISHDLARFVVNYANFFYPQDAVLANADWFERDLDIFFDGYGADGRDDPSFRYLLRMQIIKDWSNSPARLSDRNALHRHRWDGIQLLASFLF